MAGRKEGNAETQYLCRQLSGGIWRRIVNPGMIFLCIWPTCSDFRQFSSSSVIQGLLRTYYVPVYKALGLKCNIVKLKCDYDHH